MGIFVQRYVLLISRDNVPPQLSYDWEQFTAYF